VLIKKHCFYFILHQETPKGNYCQLWKITPYIIIGNRAYLWHLVGFRKKNKKCTGPSLITSHATVGDLQSNAWQYYFWYPAIVSSMVIFICIFLVHIFLKNSSDIH